MKPGNSLTQCRECGGQVSNHAPLCPHCGAPRPAKKEWDGWGFEYKSEARMFGMPLLHVSFKYRTNFMPVPARGVIAIGQFGVGIVNISQFGIGVFSLGQFCLGGWVLAQFAVGYSIIAQIGVYWESGYGQLVYAMRQLLGG